MGAARPRAGLRYRALAERGRLRGQHRAYEEQAGHGLLRHPTCGRPGPHAYTAVDEGHRYAHQLEPGDQGHPEREAGRAQAAAVVDTDPGYLVAARARGAVRPA